MPVRFILTSTAVAAVALLNVALPEPMMLDILGVSLSWIGVDLICGGLL